MSYQVKNYRGYVSLPVRGLVETGRRVHQTGRRELTSKFPLATLMQAEAILKEEGIMDVKMHPSGIAGSGRFTVVKRIT